MATKEIFNGEEGEIIAFRCKGYWYGNRCPAVILLDGPNDVHCPQCAQPHNSFGQALRLGHDLECHCTRCC